MKKYLCIILAVCMIAVSLVSCTGNNGGETGQTTAVDAQGLTSAPETEKIKVVSTVFPSYDFARQICGDLAEVDMLLPPGSESHSYEPSAQDIIKISGSDLFIYVGGENDTWVEEILSSVDTPVMTLKLTDCVSTVEEELIEGMQAEDEEHDDAQGEQEPEYDEHVWTSPQNAIVISRKISEKLCEIDAANAVAYTENVDAYIGELTALDKDFGDFLSGIDNRVMVFGDRFPFRYFADEFSVEYYAAFPGCSTDTEPSVATIAFLIDKVKEKNLSTVFYIEFSNQSVANTIAEATGAKTALLHSCHNVSPDDLDAGVTYISLMRQNLATLKEAMA